MPGENDDLDLDPNLDPALEPDPDPEPEPEQQPPDPVAVLEARLNEEREARLRLEGEMRARNTPAAAAPAAPPKKKFTRAELRTAMENGQINEDQMEEVWSNQRDDTLREEFAVEMGRREREQSVGARVKGDTQQYIDTFPEVRRQGSDEWNRVKREFDYLVSIGEAGDDTTQLKALRAALGPAERVPDRTAERRETPRGAHSPGGPGRRPVDIFNKIPQKYRSYYKDRYENGQIDLATIEKDLPYMKRMSS
jgi:hypothetical protein